MDLSKNLRFGFLNKLFIPPNTNQLRFFFGTDQQIVTFFIDSMKQGFIGCTVAFVLVVFGLNFLF